jgi:hypothetical protein
MAEPSTVSAAKARSLCTKTEYDLVAWSKAPKIKQLDARRLAAKISRARTLRDKYRGLASEQRRQMRGKGARSTAKPAEDNRNTTLKARVFEEALARFQAAQRDLAAKGSDNTGPTPQTRKKAAGRAGAKRKKKAAKAIGRKTGKRTGKKTSKKTAAKRTTGKKIARRVSKAAKKKRSAGAATEPARPPADTGARAAKRESYARSTKAKREQVRMAKGPSPRTVRGVAGITKRNQAKRDSR